MMRKLLERFVFIAIGFLPLQAYASNADYGTQSIRCSAIYYVLTKVTSVNPGLGNYFSEITQYYGAVYAEERKKLGVTTTNGQVIANRDLALKVLAQQFKTARPQLLEETNLCLSWTENIRHLAKEDDYRAAYPTQINRALVAKFEQIVLESFNSWVSDGAPTGDEALMNALKR